MNLNYPSDATAFSQFHSPSMTPDEDRRFRQVCKGISVVADIDTDKALILWAKASGLYEFVGDRPERRPDQPSWGNPFGDEPSGLEKYKKYVIENQKLKKYLPFLTGKVLGTRCSYHPNHADVLAEIVNEGG